MHRPLKKRRIYRLLVKKDIGLVPVVITELSVDLGIVYWKFDRIYYSMVELKNAHRAARNCNYEHTKSSYNVGKYATGRRQSLCICCNRNNVFIFIYSAALLDLH